jgi:hypothetical protein
MVAVWQCSTSSRTIPCTAGSTASRYFEAELYKELFTEYFNDGTKWTVVPKVAVTGPELRLQLPHLGRLYR